MRLSFALFLVTTAARAAPTPLMLLPAVGSATDDARHVLDGSLRQALLDEQTVDLMSPVDTRKHLNELAEMSSMVCIPEDTTCLVKLGATAGMTYVLVPVADAPKGQKELDVEIGVIDVANAQRVRAVKAHFASDDSAQAAALVRKALALPDKGASTSGTTASNGTTTSNGSTTSSNGSTSSNGTTPPPPETGGGITASPGVIVAAVSGSVAALALVGAVSCDLVYADILKVADARARKDIVQPAGAALWVTTTLALVGTGVGVGLLVGATPSEPP
jgi:hypothetical protein